jgi:putative PIN family toxin of toxin-antitoxin system
MIRTERRFVFDTNTLVSALLFPRSKPASAFRRAFETGVLLVSVETLDELARVLSRPKFEPYVAAAERTLFLGRYAEAATLVAVTERIALCRDPRDDRFLELAAVGAADYLVTGNEDLLVLGRFRTTRILTPAEFLDEETGRDR